MTTTTGKADSEVDCLGMLAAVGASSADTASTNSQHRKSFQQQLPVLDAGLLRL
jgi:hypothetical protein